MSAPSSPPVDEPHDLDRPRLRPSPTHHGYRHLALLARSIRDEAARARPGLTVDLGCGSKPYRSLFGGRYVGLDLGWAHGSPDIAARAERTPLRAAVADVVVSTQQLEHVDDPAAVIAEALRVLRPGGVLLLSTHGVWPHHPDPQDLWRWTEEGLTRLVESCGLRVERVHRQGELFTTAISLATYPLGALRRRGGRLGRLLAAVLLVPLNLSCAPLDALLRAVGFRHYASPGYLVVARAPGVER